MDYYKILGISQQADAEQIKQADLIAGQHELEADERREDLDKLLQDLEKEDDEYVVEGALLNCSKRTYNRQILMYKGKELKSMPIQADMRARIRVPETRACLKNHSPSLHAPLRGLLRPNLFTVAPLRLPNWVLHPTKCDVHPGESIFQTRSSTSNNK